MITAPKRFQISVSESFFKDFMGLSKQGQRAALSVVQNLSRDPTWSAKPLSGHKDVWSCRKHPYRVLFTSRKGWVHLFSVGVRGGVYDGTLEAPVDEPSTESVEIDELDLDQLLKPRTAETIVAKLDIARLELRGELSEEMLSGLLDWNVTDESLEMLLEIEIPDYIWLMCAEELKESKARDRAEARNITLIRNNVLDHFFSRVINLPPKHPVEELVIVSPWISAWKTSHSSLDALVKYIGERNVRTRIVTRPPNQDWHKSALDMLSDLATIEIYFVTNLHAKYYLCDMAPAPFSIVTSANSTRMSFNNEEVGVMVRGRGYLEPFVRDLQSLTTDLIAIAN